MNRALAAFAAHTRHAPPETDEETTMLARKWLALHVKTAPAAQVYTQVAHDYQLVALRTYGDAPLDTAYRVDPDPAAFVELMRRGYPSKQPIPKGDFAAFRDALFPKPIGHEAWMDYVRDEHWKERAYYMATQCGLKYRLVEAIHAAAPPEGGGGSLSMEQKQAATDMYERLVRYSKLHPQHAHGTAAEIGAIINQLQLVQDNCGLCSESDEDEAEDVASEDATTTNTTTTKAELVFAPPRVGEKATNADATAAATAAYRKSVGLPPAFPHDKLLKQMALARLGAVGAVVPKDVLARSQTALGPRNAVDDGTWDALKSRVAAAVAAGDVKVLETPALRELHRVLRWKGTAEDFVRTAMGLYGDAVLGAAVSDVAIARYLKKYPQCDAAIINAVIGM